MADISTPVMNTSGGELIAHVTNSMMLDTAIREQDFVTSFSRNWNSLMDIMNVTRMIRKEPGSTLKYRRAAVQLLTASGGSIDRVNFKTDEEGSDEPSLSTTNPIANWHSNNTVNNASSYFTGLVNRLTEYNPQYATFGHTSNIAEGETIPYSWGTVADIYFGELNVDKYAKAVSLEAINQWGYDSAVAETDAEFLNELQNLVLSDFYAFLQKCGSETGNAAAAASEGGNTQTWQQCLALAKGKCLNAFQKMRRTVGDVVGFANVMDLYTYLGDAPITVQTQFGQSYVQNFMGYNTLFLLSDNEIPQGTVIATPANNIVCYYCDPSHSEFGRAGLQYAVDGDTPLIGFHTQGNYNTAVSECFAIMGMTMICEFVDGVIEEKMNGGEQ